MILKEKGGEKTSNKEGNIIKKEKHKGKDNKTTEKEALRKSKCDS